VHCFVGNVLLQRILLWQAIGTTALWCLEEMSECRIPPIYQEKLGLYRKSKDSLFGGVWHEKCSSFVRRF
jgi:hypothetical protein